MIDAKKLNNTIEELENEVENIKNISKLVQEIEKVSNDILINNEAYGLVINDVKSAKDEIGKINKSTEVFLIDTNNKLDDINRTVDKRVAEIQNENISFNKEIAKVYSEMESNLLTQLQNVRNETKKLYLEIDELLTTRLDRNKSDIQVEIRNKANEVSNQIQSEVTSKIVEMNNNNQNHNKELDDKIKKQDILLYMIVIASIINIVLKFIKL